MWKASCIHYKSMANKLNADSMGYFTEDDTINTINAPLERKDISRAQREKKKQQDAAKDAKIVQLTNTVTTLKETLNEKEKIISELHRSMAEQYRITCERERMYADRLYHAMTTQQGSQGCSPIVQSHMPDLDLGQPPSTMLDENTYLSQGSDVGVFLV